MCTQITCQNEINVLTVFWLVKKFACDENDFIDQSEFFFFSDPSRGQWSPSLYKMIAASGDEIGGG